MATPQKAKPSSPEKPAEIEHRVDMARREVIDVLMRYKITIPEFCYMVEIIKFDAFHGIRQKTSQTSHEGHPRPIDSKDMAYR